MKPPRRLFKNRPARDDRDILAVCLSVEVFTLAAKMLACWLVAPDGQGMDGDRARSAFRDMVRHSLDQPWGTSGKLPFPDQRTQETVYAAMVAAAEDAIARGIDAIPEVTTEDEARRYAAAKEIVKWITWNVAMEKIGRFARMCFATLVAMGKSPEDACRIVKSDAAEALSGDPSGFFREAGDILGAAEKLGVGAGEEMASLPGMFFYILNYYGVDRDDPTIREWVSALVDRVVRECLDIDRTGQRGPRE